METIRIYDLFDLIIEHCRERAKMTAGFEDGDGAIRICCLPQGKYGERLLNLKTKYADRIELVARISPEGHYVLHRNGGGIPIDTYAFSAMKVATCLHAYEEDESHCSGTLDDPDCDETHGFGQYRGALLYELMLDDRIFALLVVSISGASQEADEYVADACTRAIEMWSSSAGLSRRLSCITPS